MEPSGNYPDLLALSQICLEAGICDYGLYPPDTRFYMDQVDCSNSVFPSNNFYFHSDLIFNKKDLSPK